MRRLLLVAALTCVAGCGGKKPPAGGWQQLAASDAVKVLRADDSPYRIIYNPPVDLAKH
ncbi:MAG TPA: hypothetical protein VGU74_12155 [Gemmatimonadales bacterium]|nr:hypothetical protein [Gemmatimonadales bacterium]